MTVHRLMKKLNLVSNFFFLHFVLKVQHDYANVNQKTKTKLKKNSSWMTASIGQGQYMTGTWYYLDRRESNGFICKPFFFRRTVPGKK